MKRKPFLHIAGAALICLFLFTVAVGQSSAPKVLAVSDTVPKRPIRDIDQSMIDINASKAEIEKALKDIDWENLQKELRQAIDASKVDLERMKEELRNATKELDAAKLQNSLSKAVKEIDAVEIHRQVEDAVAKIDIAKLNAELKKIHEVDMKKMQNEIRKIKPEIEKSLKDAKANLEAAKVEMEKAKKELVAYNTFISNLAKDGLLDKDEEYTIEYKSGELSVNGKKVSSETQQKYSNFLKNKKDFVIEKSDNGFHINN